MGKNMQIDKMWDTYLAVLEKHIPKVAGFPYDSDDHELLDEQAKRHYIKYNVIDIPSRCSPIISALKKYRKVENLKGLSLLDLACGDGAMAAYIYFKESLDLACGLELDNFRITVFNEARKALAPSHLYAVKGDANSLPFPPCSFDIISMIDFIHFAQIDLGKLLVEAHRVLKPSGTILIHTAHRLYPIHQPTWIFGLNYLPNKIARIYAAYKKVLPRFLNTKINSPFTIKRLITEAGFKKVVCFNSHGQRGIDVYMHSHIIVLARK